MRPPRSTPTPAAGAGIRERDSLIELPANQRVEYPSSGVSDHDAATFDRLIARLISLTPDWCESLAGLTPSKKGSVSVITLALLASN
jgi:hypothetical protein